MSDCSAETRRRITQRLSAAGLGWVAPIIQEGLRDCASKSTQTFTTLNCDAEGACHVASEARTVASLETGDASMFLETTTVESGVLAQLGLGWSRGDPLTRWQLTVPEPPWRETDRPQIVPSGGSPSTAYPTPLAQLRTERRADYFRLGERVFAIFSGSALVDVGPMAVHLRVPPQLATCTQRRGAYACYYRDLQDGRDVDYQEVAVAGLVLRLLLVLGLVAEATDCPKSSERVRYFSDGLSFGDGGLDVVFQGNDTSIGMPTDEVVLEDHGPSVTDAVEVSDTGTVMDGIVTDGVIDSVSADAPVGDVFVIEDTDDGFIDSIVDTVIDSMTDMVVSDSGPDATEVSIGQDTVADVISDMADGIIDVVEGLDIPVFPDTMEDLFVFFDLHGAEDTADADSTDAVSDGAVVDIAPPVDSAVPDTVVVDTMAEDVAIPDVTVPDLLILPDVADDVACEEPIPADAIQLGQKGCDVPELFLLDIDQLTSLPEIVQHLYEEVPLGVDVTLADAYCPFVLSMSAVYVYPGLAAEWMNKELSVELNPLCIMDAQVATYSDGTWLTFLAADVVEDEPCDPETTTAVYGTFLPTGSESGVVKEPYDECL
ncbi:MAG: hypothetical protein HYV02_00885 [Deltaproteobacteria bacterium]|nr:hypothetical protein [Deltaproteobacteria bacterium]